MTEEPRIDVRFLLANERTLLAWVRTALALLAAGGAVYEFTDISGRRALAAALAAVGMGTAIAGGVRYMSTVAAITAGRPLRTGGPVALAVIVMLIGAALLIAVLVG